MSYYFSTLLEELANTKSLSATGRALSTGHATPIITRPLTGVSRGATKGRVTLTLTKSVSARSTAVAVGRAVGNFMQSLFTNDPWNIAFSTVFGPVGLASPNTVRGFSSSAGRGRITGALSLTARGSTKSSGRLFIIVAGLLSGVSRSSSSGRGLGTFTLSGMIIDPWSSPFSNAFGPFTGVPGSSSSGKSSAFGKSVVTIAKPLAAHGSAAGKAAANQSYSINAVAKGVAQTKGRTTLFTPALPVARGRSSATGKTLPTYTAPPPVKGLSLTTGRGRLNLTAALTAAGTSNATGNTLSGDNILVTIGRGLGKSSGNSSNLTMTATPLANGNAMSYGRGRTGIAQFVMAHGQAASGAGGTAAYTAVSLGRGGSAAKATSNTIGSLTANLISLGMAKAAGHTSAGYQIALQTLGIVAAHGAAAPNVMRPLTGRGMGTGGGRIGTNTMLPLIARGIGGSRGATSSFAIVLLRAKGVSGAAGGLAVRVVMAMTAAGRSVATGTLSSTPKAALNSLGKSAGQGQLKQAGAATIALSGRGIGGSRAVALLNRNSLLNVIGVAASSGANQGLVGSTLLTGVSRAVGSGHLGTAVFAPIALVASGQSRSAGFNRVVGNTALHGTGVGMSIGRVAAIQSALLIANGRSNAAGRLAASAAVGFAAKGSAGATGHLSSLSAFAARGVSGGFGSGSLAAYYNVTPDIVGPRLSSIGQLPFFDSMDFGDIDFFSWDWSGRASITADPIISASVTATPSGMPVTSVVIVGDIVQARCGAALLAETFSLRCTVTLRSGRVLHWSAPVSVDVM